MKFILIIALGLAGLSVAGNFRKTALVLQDRTRLTKADKEAEKAAARRVQNGLGGGRKTIPQEVLETRADLFKRLEVGLLVLTPNTPFNADDYLAERACAADAILIGVVNERRGHLTDDETFVFSNHQLSIERIIKNDTKIVLTPKTTIDVSRAGGEIFVQGHHVKAISQAAQPLEIGNRYLLFLTFLPEKNTFVANNLAFLIEGNGVTKLTDDAQAAQIGTGKGVDVFVNQVQEASTTRCMTEGSSQ